MKAALRACVDNTSKRSNAVRHTVHQAVALQPTAHQERARERNTMGVQGREKTHQVQTCSRTSTFEAGLGFLPTPERQHLVCEEHDIKKEGTYTWERVVSARWAFNVDTCTFCSSLSGDRVQKCATSPLPHRALSAKCASEKEKVRCSKSRLLFIRP